MGEVKEELKGSAPKRKAKQKTNQNVLEQVKDLRDEVSRLIAVKDEDTEIEGATAAPENIRKAASLRASHTLLTAIQTLLEDY